MRERWWDGDQSVARGRPWIALDAVIAWLSASITVGASDVTAGLTDGPVAVRLAAILWFGSITLRRLAPVTCLWVGALGSALVGGVGYPLTNLSLSTALALALVVRTRPARAAAALSAVPLLVTVVSLVVNREAQLMLAYAGLTHLIAVIYGLVARAGTRTREEREDLGRRQAIDAERARLARDLHDAVGHAVTLMLTHAGAARLSLPAPEGPVHQSLTSIETAGRAAMADLDRILHLLDAPAEEAALRQRLDALAKGMPDQFPTILSQHRSPDGPRLPPAVAEVVYRTVQESLTNVVRHSTATKVEVIIDHRADRVRIDVHDNGGTRTMKDATAGDRRPGRGLAGMRSRVEDLDGTFEAGADPGGGWRVRADLPLTGATR
jgi:signal transduction histidine kinase